MITSAHNPKVQLVEKLLGRPRERQDENAFVAEGVRLVEEALAADRPIRFALFTEELSDRGMALVETLKSRKIYVEQVSPSVLKTISETKHSQGLLAVLDLSPLPFPAHPTFVLVLDALRDPGNLGTLLRTAAAAGVQAVLLSPGTTDAFAPKVIRSGMGAHFRLPILPLSWDEISARLKGLYTYWADMEGQVICWEADFKQPLALIVGGEAEGVSPAARQLAGQSVGIPMPGKAESLNAAIAGAILMFEVVRQRND